MKNEDERGIALIKLIGAFILAYLIWLLIVFVWSTWFVKKTTETVVDVGKDIVNTFQEEAQKGDITMAEFNQIQVGMTYSQVVDIIGAEGTFSSETQISGENYKYYTWNGVGFRSECKYSIL